MKIKALAQKIGREMWTEVKCMIIDIASETTLKAMGIK
jgi:hypothetical protein